MSTAAPCALCQNDAPLRESHIMPEFLYSAVYDENHRFLQSSTDPGERTVSRPLGLYERLLCGNCETRLSVWETYGSGVLRGGPALRYQMEAGGFVVRDVDYSCFKLFGMSMLWRAGRSRRPEFTAVELSPHEERLRRMLHRGDPGRSFDYGFTIVFPRDPEAQQLFGHTIAPPHAIRYQAHWVYRFLLGVTIWLFPVSNHTGDLDSAIFSLLEDGTLHIRNGGQPVVNYLTRLGLDLATANAARGRR